MNRPTLRPVNLASSRPPFLLNWKETIMRCGLFGSCWGTACWRFAPETISSFESMNMYLALPPSCRGIHSSNQTNSASSGIAAMTSG